tara:strand:- start:284 stop:1396 length:1113 start_codon:yes stop_codon:yes gene_type:complete
MTVYSSIKACTSTKCSKDCTHRVRYKDRTGTWRDKHCKSYRDAKAFENKIIKQLELGVLSSEYAQKITLNEFIKQVPLTKGNETTKVVMEQLYDKHIRDTLGLYKLKDITRTDIQTFMDTNLAGYSPTSKKKINRILSTAFKYASSDGLIVRNPAEQVVIEGEMREREPQPLTPEQLKEFIQVWDDDEVLCEYTNVIVALAYTGMRPQEMGALQWDDVDLTARTLDLNKAIKKDPQGSQFDSPIMKSKSASRILAIDDELLARLRFRKTTNPNDKYVFSSSLGHQINLNNFRGRYFRKAMLMTDLPIERPYDLRHTFSALMWSRGVNVERLSRMMGHSSVSVTQQWYGTWYRQADFSGIETLEKWKEEQA